jgi:hypothetical protein
MIKNDELLSLPKFIGIKYAEKLGLSKYQFHRFTQERNAPSVKIGGKLYLDRDRLIEYFDKQMEENCELQD